MRKNKHFCSDLKCKSMGNVFSVNLVWKEELNLMLEISLLVNVRWAEPRGTDYLS